MKCPRCQQENPLQARFCMKCGAGLTLACAKCSTELPAGAAFCFACGQPVGTPPATQARFASPETYTPKHLADKILTSKSALEGERKQVTVLFADLKGSMELLADRDPEEARKLLDPVLERMMEAVHRYEGTVNQVMGDGIMALFGAPVAHEDHAVRACYAGLRMQESVTRYTDEIQRTHGVPVQIRVGLNSGEVVVRSIGSDLRMDYTAVGQTTHLAARMEQMAKPGTVLITARTLQLAEGYVQVKPLGPVLVKGLETPLDVWELVGARAVRSRLQAAAARGLTRFVGRDVELEQLRKALELARGGHGQVLAVVGEPGVGKSRLFYEFIHSHWTSGWLVLESASVSYGKATSYLPVIDLLKSYFRIEDADETRGIREKVTGKLLTLDEVLKDAIPAVLALLEALPEDNPFKMLDPSQRRQRTLEAIKRLLLRESRIQPLCLVFEDLHWIDTETQVLLDSLAESLPTTRILLLVNYRPEYQHAWGSKTYYTQLRIDPLPPERAGELLQALLGDDPGLQPLKRLLIERTEGNPFFLEESVRSLVETKMLVGDRGTYRLAKPLSAIQVPATVQAVLAARIDRLPPEEKHLLQIAAVIGKDVAVSLLQAVAERPDDALRRELAHLQAAEFLYETSVFPDPEFTFKHALTLEVAYGSLLQERRRLLHGRVLDALEQLFADRATEQVELLAHHAVRSEKWERAARYLYQAGEKAVAYAAYRSGAQFYEAAVDAVDRQGKEGDLALKLDAYLELWVTRIDTGQFKDLRELADKAEALALSLNDGPRLAQVRVRQAQAHWWVWRHPGALEAAIERAREAWSLADPRDVRTQSYAHYVMGAACRDLGRLREAISEYDAAIALLAGSESQRDAPGLVLPIYVTTRAFQAEACAALGEFQQGLALAADGLRMARQIAHLPSIALAHALSGYVHILKGHVDAALPLLESGLKIGEENGFIHGIVTNAMYLGYALVLLGERERGLNRLAQAIQAAEPIGYTIGLWAQYGTVSASMYLVAGNLAEAHAAATQGFALAIAKNARGYQAPLLRLQAEVIRRREPGEFDKALHCLQQSLALATELGMRPELAHGHLALGRMYRSVDDHARVREYLDSAINMFRDMEMPFWLEQARAEMLE